jgi:hypothetical protein
LKRCGRVYKNIKGFADGAEGASEPVLEELVLAMGWQGDGKKWGGTPRLRLQSAHYRVVLSRV